MDDVKKKLCFSRGSALSIAYQSQAAHKAALKSVSIHPAIHSDAIYGDVTLTSFPRTPQTNKNIPELDW
jgi:hypothetical protein